MSVELPAGSDVRGTSAMGGFFCEGRFGDVTLKTSLGDVQVDETAGAVLKTDHGGIRLARSTGDVEIIGAGRRSSQATSRYAPRTPPDDRAAARTAAGLCPAGAVALDSPGG